MTKIDDVLRSDTVSILARIIGFVAAGLGGWALLVLLDVQRDVAILKVTVASSAQDRYRADEARRDFELRDLKISTLQGRIDAIEREVHSTNTKVEEIAPAVRRRAQ
jgi:hypothetical protein